MNNPGMPAGGFVSLVGAGPGDPELITVRGLARLRAADAVVYDRLVAPELLDHCRAETRRYDVGKTPGQPGRGRQEEINALLISLAHEGLQVVRLKGGDPLVFGRGGEEALALAEADVPFEIVPGITSAFAAPAAAGIPVTHRGLAASVTVIAGQGASGEQDGAGHDWHALAHMRGTLVFLMAVENLERIVARLLAHGRPANEPASLVRWGTTERQEVIVAPLGEITERARNAGMMPPAVLVVGPGVEIAAQIGRTMVPGQSADKHLPARTRS
jgi:uroporphyrin-III C-methyltransferase